MGIKISLKTFLDDESSIIATMDFSKSNYFDLIALPSTVPCVQPSDFNPDEYAVHGFTVDNGWTEMGECESPCYTELTTYTPTYESTSTELDQFLMLDYEDSISVTTFDNLPDQTLMCTDECEKFLKESSEILRVNSLKFQQQDESMTREIKSDEAEEKVFFNCNFSDCKKTYSKPAHLRAHLRRHLGLKPYFCNFPNCSWKFSRSDGI